MTIAAEIESLLRLWDVRLRSAWTIIAILTDQCRSSWSVHSAKIRNDVLRIPRNPSKSWGCSPHAKRHAPHLELAERPDTVWLRQAESSRFFVFWSDAEKQSPGFKICKDWVKCETAWSLSGVTQRVGKTIAGGSSLHCTVDATNCTCGRWVLDISNGPQNTRDFAARMSLVFLLCLMMSFHQC